MSGTGPGESRSLEDLVQRMAELLGERPMRLLLTATSTPIRARALPEILE